MERIKGTILPVQTWAQLSPSKYKADMVWLWQDWRLWDKYFSSTSPRKYWFHGCDSKIISQSNKISFTRWARNAGEPVSFQTFQETMQCLRVHSIWFLPTKTKQYRMLQGWSSPDADQMFSVWRMAWGMQTICVPSQKQGASMAWNRTSNATN